MEESDIEEGEAMHNEAVDPDVDLSYIDDRIQDVLGHFQKEFEGTVCADNLGSKFGAYGSFLPTYQRSPSGIPRPNSPQKLGGYDDARPPSDRQCEGACPSTSAPTNSAGSLKIRRISTVHPCDDSGKKGAWRTECGGGSESAVQHDFSNRAMNSDETKTLKVRIKVGPENALARNNAAIYSGLGLDMSPSPSPEESPVGEPAPKIQDALDESPSTIFQFYSGFQAAILVTYLLSPVGESPLCMTEKSIPYVKERKHEVVPLNAIESKEQSKSQKSTEKIVRILNCKDGSSKICVNLNEDNDVEAPSRKKISAEVLGIPSLSKFTDNKDQKLVPRKVASVSKGLDEIVEKENMPLPDLVDEDPLNAPPVQRLGSRSDALYWKGELDSKANTADKISRDAKLLAVGDEANIKNGKFIKDNARRSADFIRKDPDGIKGRNDVGLPAEHDKLKAPKKSGFLEHDAEKVLPGKSKSSAGKRKLNSSLDNGVAALEIVRENVGDATPSVRLKEKKKNSHSKKVQLEHNSNTCKPYEDPNGISASERKTSDAGPFGPGYRRSDGQENIASAMSQDCKLDHGDAILYVEKTEEKTGSKRHANRPTSEAFDKGAQPALPRGNSLITNEVPQPPAPVVIEESWVGCDRCEKWRLLPYGIEPKQLPKKWVCNMISWLPGMNRCTVSEEETTKALRALYLLPAPEAQVAQNSHNDLAHSGITFADPQHIPQSCDPVHQSVSSIAKKKLKQKDALNIANRSVLSQPVNLVRESSSASTKSRNLSDANEYALGRIGQQQTSKSADIKSERRKNKSKEKSLDEYPEGGDFVELEGKKFKAQGQNVQDSLRPSKKMKSRDSHIIADDRHLNHDMDGKTGQGISGLQAKMSTKNALKEEHLSSKASVLDHKDGSTHGKQVKAPRQAVTNGLLDHLSSMEVEKSDSVKKRKMKDAQKFFVHQAVDRHDCQEEIGDTTINKVKKARLSKCEGRELDTCKVDGRIESLSKFPVASRDLLMDGNGENQGDDDSLLHQNGRDLDAVDSLKRDFCFSQHSAAATSSSSKVSGSHRSKANLVDGRSSPVESVSSSPFRNFSSDKDAKRSSKVNTNRTNAGFTITGDSRRLSGGDANGSYGHYGQKSREKSDSVHAQSLERKRAPESRALDSKIVEGGCNLQGREVARMSAVKAKDLLFTKIFGGPSHSDREDINPDIDTGRTSEELNRVSSDIQGNDCSNHHEILKYSDSKEQIRQSKSGKNNLKHERKRNYKMETDKGIELQNNDVEKEQKDCMAKIGIKPSINMIKEFNSCTGVQVKVGANGTSIPVYRNRDNSRVEVEAMAFSDGNAHRTLSRGEEKCSRQSPLHGSDKRDTYSGKSKPESYNHVKDHKGDPPCRNPHTKSAPHRSSDVMVSVEPASRDAMNALKHTEKVDSSSRNLIPNGVDATIPLRRDGGQSMADILKEARDLKHAANRLKDEGSEQISTAMYFESALKFLHVASLSDNAKHGDNFSPMQMYTDTAKLCEFCAHEYEKYKELASAALAYKCMEVAYMKVVYSKSSTANKDRHELLSAPQIGESPSSSASDVENNHAMLDKGSLVEKAANSPLIAGNHVIAARNRLNFTRILGFVEMVNLAMEASRRALNAFTSASAQKDARHTEIIASVRRVLEFSFHDVEGLLRLVRLSMEVMGR